MDWRHGCTCHVFCFVHFVNWKILEYVTVKNELSKSWPRLKSMTLLWPWMTCQHIRGSEHAFWFGRIFLTNFTFWEIDHLRVKRVKFYFLQCSSCFLPFLSILFPALKDLANAEKSFQTDALNTILWLANACLDLIGREGFD